MLSTSILSKIKGFRAFKIKWNTGGTHPTRLDFKGNPYHCIGSMTAIVTKDCVALSMNSTTVLTWDELLHVVKDITEMRDKIE